MALNRGQSYVWIECDRKYDKNDVTMVILMTMSQIKNAETPLSAAVATQIAVEKKQKIFYAAL